LTAELAMKEKAAAELAEREAAKVKAALAEERK